MKEVTKKIKDYLLSVGYPDKEKIYYLEVWLWLWREKHIAISPQLWYEGLDKWGSIIETATFYIIETATFYNELFDYNDPEEAIIAAIEHIVDNKLLK